MFGRTAYVDLLERRPLPRRRCRCGLRANTAFRLQQTTTTNRVVVSVMNTNIAEIITTVVNDCALSRVRTMSTSRFSDVRRLTGTEAADDVNIEGDFSVVDWTGFGVITLYVPSPNTHAIRQASVLVHPCNIQMCWWNRYSDAPKLHASPEFWDPIIPDPTHGPSMTDKKSQSF